LKKGGFAYPNRCKFLFSKIWWGWGYCRL